MTLFNHRTTDNRKLYAFTRAAQHSNAEVKVKLGLMKRSSTGGIGAIIVE
uniref:Uncharacterized protein n=1 Tax=Parascaris equorum TaxID=6256 RepID=A0A914SDV7_PAREQ